MCALRHIPEIRSLAREECILLLARHHVGRLGVANGGRVDIYPLHYVYDDEWIYFRTSPGGKLEALAHRPWVAFEVDEVHGALDWTSVVAHGTAYRLDEGQRTHDPEAEQRGLALLRELTPEIFTPGDPTPHRHIIVRVAVKEITGRQASASWRAAGEGRDTMSY